MMASYSLMAAAIATIAGLLSLAQAVIGSRIGTDNAAHLFMIRQVRKSGGLFTRIPDLLNRPACGAFPIYLHLLLSKLPAGGLRIAPYLLNPLVNAVHVGLFAIIAKWFAQAAGLPSQFALAAAALFAFCPQFYHALSARNFGFSSRGIGLLLLTVFFGGYGATELAAISPTAGWCAMILAAFLIFAFNTFAMQALFIVGALLVPIRMDATHWLAIGAGLALFVAIHPSYSLSYLKYTARFIRAYARDLAPVFILARRYSIWRDLVWDIPRRFGAGAVAGLHYLYDNSLIVVILLSPLTIAAVLGYFDPVGAAPGPIAFAAQVALAGTLAMLATSFRPTRFLGEPERYVEATAPWITIAGAAWVWVRFPPGVTWTLVIGFAAFSLAQLTLSRFLANRVVHAPDTTDAIASAIREQMSDRDVRLVSNNEQLTKLLLPNDWRFSYFVAVGERYCGMDAAETFTLFPLLRQTALERIVREYRITVAVLQKAHFGSLFNDGLPEGVHATQTILETPAVKVLQICWEDSSSPKRPEA